MANPWATVVTGSITTVLGWFLAPIISLLLNRILFHIGFDASRKLQELDVHIIPKMKQALRDIVEQRIQRKARKERDAVSTLDKLAKDVKSALCEAEDILDLIDYHQIKKEKIIGHGEPQDRSWLDFWMQSISKSFRTWIACCQRSLFGKCVRTICAPLQRWVRSLHPVGRILHAALHRSALILPISDGPSVSFSWVLGQAMLTRVSNIAEIAHYYRNLSYEVVVGITSYQDDDVTVDFFLPIIARWTLRKRIEELENVVTNVKKSHFLNQQSSNGWNTSANINRRSVRSSTTRKVFGRDMEREKITNILHDGPDDDEPSASSSKCYSVVCIHGIPGSGKTTLAQYVCDYEKEDKNKYFDPIMLIHVSETFRVEDILHDMLEEMTEKRHSNINGCKELQAKLMEELRGRRFLLVLGDLWVTDENQQDLEEILAPLSVGKGGSKILVTTRNKEAALGAKRLISISDLNEEQYFSMFMHYALDSTIYDDRKYIPIGRKIAKKLCRSPIAAVTVAGQLWRNPDIKFWETTARLDMLNKTKGALWWSYQQLDVDVRRCFEYCNIFPRRYELERDQLVHMWIAQGFVKTIDAREEEDAEDVGQDYFHDLHSCAFLQLKRKTNSDISSGEFFTVHDLLHDLAEAIAGSDCVRINRGVVGEIPKHVRHLCIESYSEIAFPEKILELRNLSTLIMCYSVNQISQDDFKHVLMRLRKLRVVQLDIKWLNRIPTCIGQLKHLRYLGVSVPPPNQITLPAEFTMLYHLQELSVPPNTLLYCDSKDKMANLVNLRHMITWYGLNFPNIGRLTSLQALYHFYVKNEKGYEIQQLKHLNNLRGKLFIECLENIRSKEEAVQARLIDKVHLTELTLQWGGMDEISRRKQKGMMELRNLFASVTPAGVPEWRTCLQSCSAELQAEVLEGLHPPPQITVLCIRNYGGLRYPSWLSGEWSTRDRNTDVPDLQNLMFWDCGGSHMPTKIGEHFVHLRILTITGCNWASLPENLDRLASLEELKIHDCPNIESLPLLPLSLTKFELAGCNPSLTSSCRTKEHPNWRKIRHITKKLLR